MLSKLLSDRSRCTSCSRVGVDFPVPENMRVKREAMVALVGLPGERAGEGRTSPFGWADRFMPAKARVTEGSPSRGSCECCEAAAEETAEGTGEGEGGVMCGGSRGVGEVKLQNSTSSPRRRERRKVRIYEEEQNCESAKVRECATEPAKGPEARLTQTKR